MARLDLGQENLATHRVDRMEERSVLRRPFLNHKTAECYSEQVPPLPGFFWRWAAGSGDTRVRERSSCE